jgi:FHS family L-fucose permease-like MFS transporter
MAFSASPNTNGSFSLQNRTDYRAMGIACALFFMWGFLTCLNDILIPHLKSIFDLTYAQAMLVQVAFFTSYVVFALPAGKLVELRGYKSTMVTGLMVMAVGALLFLPASSLASFPLFLGGLIVLAAGITALQVAANPYVASLGPEETSSSRLNFAQALNSLGTTVAPLVGGALILSAEEAMAPEKLQALSAGALQTYRAAQASSVRLPYIVIAAALVVLAVALLLIKLPSSRNNTVDYRPNPLTHESIFQHPWLMAAALGIFLYVGAEVSIGSLMVSYFELPQIAGMQAREAAHYVSYYWGGALIGRLIGAAVLQRIRTGWVLGACALAAVMMVAISLTSHGNVAMWTLIAVGLCNSVMFPSIFALGLVDLGELTSMGSSVMVMAIVGGAIVPYLVGKLADANGLQHALFLPVLCYLFIAAFGFASVRRKPLFPALPPEMV